MPILLIIFIIALAAAGGGIWYGWREHTLAETLLNEAADAQGQPLATTNEVERVLRALIEAIPSPVFLTTADRVILHANRAAQYLSLIHI